MRTRIFIQLAAALLITLPVAKASIGSAVTGNVIVDTRSWTLNSSVTGSGSVQGAGTYPSQTTATLTAVPSPGNLFIGWTGDASGTTNPLEILMNSHKTVGATFVPDSGGPGENAPFAAGDSYAASTNSSLVVPAMGVLTNDNNPSSGTLTAWLVTGPQHGVLTLNSNGGFTYTPAPGYSGADSFSYRASDGAAISNVATVSLSVVSGTSQMIINGSFESDLNAWNASGNMEIQSPSPAPPDGSKLLAFNAGNLQATGVISQSFTTLPGSTYQLAFHVGVIAYNTLDQRLQVDVDGSGNLLSQTVTVTGTGNGSTLWSPQAFSFIANSASTTLTFRDVSSSSNNLDLLLDHVRVTGSSPAFTLTVDSSTGNGTSVAMSPPDLNGNASGTTQLTRNFIASTIVNLSVPANVAGINFLKWTKNGADYSSNRSINVTMDANTGLVAVYALNSDPVVATPIPDQNATEDVAFSYTFPASTFTDVDAENVLAYSAAWLPGWLSFEPGTRTFSGTPGDADGGFADITITATDNGTPEAAMVSDTFRITVSGVNDVPVFAKGTDPSLPAGTTSPQTVVGWATGISDGDELVEQSLTFLANSDNPSIFATAPAISSNGTLTYTPSGTEGTATVSVSLTDDNSAGGSALVSPVQTFTITFTNSTGPAGGRMTLTPGTTVIAGSALTVAFADWSDPNGPLVYEILVSDTVVSASGPAAVREISAPSTAGTYTLKGRILDALGNATEVIQDVMVRPILTALESWRLDKFGSAGNSGDGADNFDFDGDGVPNLVEYAFGMNPKVADSPLLPLPVLNAGTLTLSYPVPPGVGGISYGAQWNTTLAPEGWTDIADTGTPEQRVFSVQTTNRDRIFMRHAVKSE